MLERSSAGSVALPRARLGALADRRLAALAPAAPAALLLLHQSYYLAALGDAIDDAYISFRYAANLVHGQGLVFNPGRPVQGYTNFLWTVLLAPAIAAGLPPGPVALLLGALCALATLLLVAGRLTPGRPAVGLLAAALLAADGSFALWSVSGMETALFTLLLLAGAVRYWRELAAPRLLPWSGPLFALATLTRPEGALVFGLTVLHAGAYRLLAQHRPPAWSDAGRLLGCAAPVGAYLAFCLAYYGSVVPNTFADKVDPGSLAQLLRGWRALATFVGVHGGWPALLLLPLGCWSLWRGGPAGARLRAGYAALVALPYGAYIVLVGGDWSVGRFFVPILPFVYVLASAGCLALLGPLTGGTPTPGRQTRGPHAGPSGLRAGLARLKGRRRPGGAVATGEGEGERAGGVALDEGEGERAGRAAEASALGITPRALLPLALLLFLLFAHSSAEGERLLFVDAFAVRTMGQARTDMGRWLRDNAAPGAVIAVDAAGQMPYYAGHRVIDLYGLNDPAIAHLTSAQEGRALAGHEKFGLDYALRVDRPDYVAIYGDLLDAPVYQGEYHRLDVPWTPDPARRALLSLYQRNGPAAGCAFSGRFRALHDRLPAKVGDCLDDERRDPGTGAIIQHSRGGLLTRPAAGGWAAFSDGYRTWVAGPDGLQERLNDERFPWEPNPTGLPLAPTAH